MTATPIPSGLPGRERQADAPGDAIRGVAGQSVQFKVILSGSSPHGPDIAIKLAVSPRHEPAAG
jgi:hypothetical protein